MLVWRPPTGAGSHRHRRGAPGAHLVTATKPGRDPLGLACEIRFARTGSHDYDDVLAQQPEDARDRLTWDDLKGVNFSRLDDVHPWVHVLIEQQAYTRVLAQLEAAGTPGGPICGYRWRNHHERTPPCMRLYCPSCWLTKLEYAAEALSNTAAPIFGVHYSDPINLVAPLGPEILPLKTFKAMTQEANLRKAGDRGNCWFPIFWSFFPIRGELTYRFVGIFVAAAPVKRNRATTDPGSLPEVYGVPVRRVIELVDGSPTTIYVREIGFEDRLLAWRYFRSLTPFRPVAQGSGITPGEAPAPDSTPDLIMEQRHADHWPNRFRTYPANFGRFGDPGPQEPLDPGRLRLDPDDLAEIYT